MNNRTLWTGFAAMMVILFSRHILVHPAIMLVPMAVSGWILGGCIAKAAKYDAR